MGKNEALIFGKPIELKSVGCNHDDVPGGLIPASVNLFVKITNGCNAHCRFCSNAGHKPITHFNADKLIDVVREIKANNILVNRINITGGEPSIVPDTVSDLLERLSDDCFNDIHVHLNTNGLLPASQQLMKHSRWDSISVSLHHYDREKLGEIYQTTISDTALDFDGIDMKIVNVSCNLIKGYVDSTEEAHKMMDFCIDKGITRIGFVGLMPTKQYCRDRVVRLDELKLGTIPHCYFTESKNRGKDCRCSNYLYNRDLKILEIYMRHYANPMYCESSLLYDGEYLRQGFHDNNIIY